MAIHHNSFCTLSLAERIQVFYLQMKFQQKESFDCSSFEERERRGEREGGRAGGGKKTFTKVHKSLHSASSPTRKKKGSTLHSSHWLHENSIPKIGCYYFWGGLLALPKNSVRIHCQLWIRFVRKLSTWVLFVPGNSERLWNREKFYS